jgi:small subunit ribosomal protein S2
MPRKKKVETEKKEKIGTKTEKKKEEPNLLVPLEDYIRCSVHIGTRVITPTMKQYVYRRKADGLAVINTSMIDEKIRTAASFISQYSPEDIIIVCKREAGWNAVIKFSEITGIRSFTKKYPAGIITNPKLDDFFEPKLLIIIDPWVDKNALNDAVKIHIPIMGLCDTNNNTNYIDVVAPCNNKTKKSIGLVLYLLAKLYCKAKRIKTKINKDDFYIIEDSEDRKYKGKKVEKKLAVVKEGV